MGTLLIAVPNVAVAHDDDESGTPIQYDQKRARLLFRHYCMDCHGPKMTGDEHDETLFCPDVQGKDMDDYEEAVREGPDDMPEFEIKSLPGTTDGYLVLSFDDLKLLTLHETTFRPDQP